MSTRKTGPAPVEERLADGRPAQQPWHVVSHRSEAEDRFFSRQLSRIEPGVIEMQMPAMVSPMMLPVDIAAWDLALTPKEDA